MSLYEYKKGKYILNYNTQGFFRCPNGQHHDVVGVGNWRTKTLSHKEVETKEGFITTNKLLRFKVKKTSELKCRRCKTPLVFEGYSVWLYEKVRKGSTQISFRHGHLKELYTKRFKTRKEQKEFVEHERDRLWKINNKDEG